MDTKTEIAEPATRRGNGSYSASHTSSQRMKPAHWIVFIVVCVVLGLLVFETVIHVIGTNTGKARLFRAPAPVEAPAGTDAAGWPVWLNGAQ